MPSLHLNLGRSYGDAGDLERAMTSYREAAACLDALDDDGYGALARTGMLQLVFCTLLSIGLLAS